MPSSSTVAAAAAAITAEKEADSTQPADESEEVPFSVAVVGASEDDKSSQATEVPVAVVGVREPSYSVQLAPVLLLKPGRHVQLYVASPVRVHSEFAPHSPSTVHGSNALQASKQQQRGGIYDGVSVTCAGGSHDGLPRRKICR